MKKFLGLFTVFVLTVLIIPQNSFAVSMTSKELRVQIEALQKEIEALQKQLAKSEEEPQEWCHDFNKNLKIGDEGEEIDSLNQTLEKEGFLESGNFEHSSNFEGSFDEQTASAVVSFQEKYRNEILTPSGLKHGTGFVGKATRKVLNRLYGCGEPVSKNLPVNNSNEHSIIVVSPNGGEIFKEGEARVIKWDKGSINFDNIQLDYYPEGYSDLIGKAPTEGINAPSLIGFISDLKENTFVWNVPKNIKEKWEMFPGVKVDGKYRIRIQTGEKYYSDDSDVSFSIVSLDKNESPKITSILPSIASERAMVIIYGAGFKAGASVLFNSPEGPSIKAASISTDGKSLTFTIPVGFDAGVYRVAVSNLDGTENSNEMNFTVVK